MNVGVVPRHLFPTWATTLAVMISNMYMRGNLLLAILSKEKKPSFDAEFDPRHKHYEVQIDADADVADIDQVVPIPEAKKANLELNNSSPQAMSMVANNITSVTNPPNNPPNPSSITDIPLMNEEKPCEKPED